MEARRSQLKAPDGRESAVSVRRFVNDEIANIARRYDDGSTLFEFLCECGELKCRGLVSMTLADYRASKPGSVLNHD